MRAKDGGPAFPSQPVMTMPGGVQMVLEQGGMTLRDYFAAKAMVAIYHFAGERNPHGKNPPITAEDIAFDAYEMADAMLKAREVKP